MWKINIYSFGSLGPEPTLFGKPKFSCMRLHYRYKEASGYFHTLRAVMRNPEEDGKGKRGESIQLQLICFYKPKCSWGLHIPLYKWVIRKNTFVIWDLEIATLFPAVQGYKLISLGKEIYYGTLQPAWPFECDGFSYHIRLSWISQEQRLSCLCLLSQHLAQCVDRWEFPNKLLIPIDLVLLLFI